MRKGIRILLSIRIPFQVAPLRLTSILQPRCQTGRIQNTGVSRAEGKAEAGDRQILRAAARISWVVEGNSRRICTPGRAGDWKLRFSRSEMTKGQSGCRASQSRASRGDAVTHRSRRSERRGRSASAVAGLDETTQAIAPEGSQ